MPEPRPGRPTASPTVDASGVAGTTGNAAAGAGGEPRWAALLAALPVLIPVAVAGFAVPAMLLLLLSAYLSVLVFPLGLLGAVLAVRLVGLRGGAAGLPAGRLARCCDALALTLGAAWAAVNGALSSQDLVVDRDPAVYVIAGRWLATHHGLRIGNEGTVFGTLPNLIYTGSGFGRSGTTKLFAQGAHLLPALTALITRTVGEATALRSNAVIGAAALVAVYGLGRRVLPPLWALVAVAGLALSLPEIHFARDMYTEPLAQLLAVGALALLVQHWRRPSPAVMAAAGLCAGAVCLARIDGFLLLAGIGVPAVLALLTATPGHRRATLRWAGALVLGAAVPAELALLDLTQLANGYYVTESASIHQELEVLGLLVGGGAALVAAAWRVPVVGVVLHRAARASERWRGAALGGAVLVVFGALASRPLWQTARQAPSDLVASLQQGARMPSDPTRSYAEHTVAWLSYYLGPAAVTLGGLGFVLLAVRSVARRSARPELLPLVCGVLLVSTVYLLQPSITPDQIWASRRFLPLTMPGFLVAAAYACRWPTTLRLRWPAQPHRRPAARRAVTAAGLVVAAVVVASPPALARSVLRGREYASERSVLATLCRSLPAHPAVLIVGQAGPQWVVAVHTFCAVPTVRVDRITQQQVAQLRRTVASHGRTLVLLDMPGVGPGAPLPPLDAAAVHGARLVVDSIQSHLQQRLTGAPHRLDFVRRVVRLGRVDPDGSIHDPDAELPGAASAG